MELKVCVEGIDRSISGITEQTTCAQIIYALAHATSQKGRFVMIEKFRNAERRLSPNDRPLEVLNKWGEHAASVSFVLQKIDDNALCSPDLSMSSETTSSHVQLSSNNRSTSSLRSTGGGSRPPPPDYNSVMEQKYASLNRGAQPRTPLPMVAGDRNGFGRVSNDEMTIAKMGLSQSDLLALIDQQAKTIEQQKLKLLSSEISLGNDAERELLQLQKQQENLRVVLEPLRAANLSGRYQKELKESQRLRAAIEANKEAINKNSCDIERMAREEEQLLRQTAELEESFTLDTTISSSPVYPMNNASSPQKAQRC